MEYNPKPTPEQLETMSQIATVAKECGGAAVFKDANGGVITPDQVDFFAKVASCEVANPEPSIPNPNPGKPQPVKILKEETNPDGTKTVSEVTPQEMKDDLTRMTGIEGGGLVKIVGPTVTVADGRGAAAKLQEGRPE